MKKMKILNGWNFLLLFSHLLNNAKKSFQNQVTNVREERFQTRQTFLSEVLMAKKNLVRAVIQISYNICLKFEKNIGCETLIKTTKMMILL